MTYWLGKGCPQKSLVDKNSNMSHQYGAVVKVVNRMLNYISMNMSHRLKDVIISLYRTLLITSRVLYLGWLLKTRKFLTYIFEFNEQLSRKLGG